MTDAPELQPLVDAVRSFFDPATQDGYKRSEFATGELGHFHRLVEDTVERILAARETPDGDGPTGTSATTEVQSEPPIVLEVRAGGIRGEQAWLDLKASRPNADPVFIEWGDVDGRVELRLVNGSWKVLSVVRDGWPTNPVCFDPALSDERDGFAARFFAIEERPNGLYAVGEIVNLRSKSIVIRAEITYRMPRGRFKTRKHAARRVVRNKIPAGRSILQVCWFRPLPETAEDAELRFTITNALHGTTLRLRLPPGSTGKRASECL
jgi:hypothetical protein